MLYHLEVEIGKLVLEIIFIGKLIKPLQNKHEEKVCIFHNLKSSDQNYTPFWEVCLSQPQVRDSILKSVGKIYSTLLRSNQVI